MPVTLAACTLFWVNWKWIVSISSASTAPSKESRAMPDTLGQGAQLFLVQRRSTERRLAPRLEHASVARTACGSVGQVLAVSTDALRVPLQFCPFTYHLAACHVLLGALGCTLARHTCVFHLVRPERWTRAWRWPTFMLTVWEKEAAGERSAGFFEWTKQVISTEVGGAHADTRISTSLSASLAPEEPALPIVVLAAGCRRRLGTCWLRSWAGGTCCGALSRRG